MRQLFNLRLVGEGMWVEVRYLFMTFLVGLVTPWLAQPPGNKGHNEPWHTYDKK